VPVLARGTPSAHLIMFLPHGVDPAAAHSVVHQLDEV
jgi:hypothetical protein